MASQGARREAIPVNHTGDLSPFVKDRKKEIGPGLLQKMLSDLGLDKTDIRVVVR